MNKKGFTLIEILIVLAIIGILAGLIIAVINPAQQRAKANQTILRANISKACLAAVTCANSSSTATCTTQTAIAGNEFTLVAGNPAGSTYAVTTQGAPLSLATISGTLGTCTVTCDVGAASGTNPISLSAGCLID